MLIILLAAAMTIAMLIATAVALHQESAKPKYLENRIGVDRFNRRR